MGFFLGEYRGKFLVSFWSLTSVIPASLASSVAMVVLLTDTTVNFPSNFLNLLMRGAMLSPWR